MSGNADIDAEARSGCLIRVRGIVQGVGFRPFVWRLACEEGLTGSVCNDADGVLIEAHGVRRGIDRLVDRLAREAPPLARVEGLEVVPAFGVAPATFVIASSRAGAPRTGIAADAAACPACLAEIRNPSDRRYRYAFANCTHCGPRLSIVRRIPYDRAGTSMAAFPMCSTCAGEYADPMDRRFHAEPIACPSCGPRLWLETEGCEASIEDPLADAARLIAQGRVVAIKGIGGFHLACDATNADAVAELRRRKVRDAKPFALMVRNLAMARSLARVSAQEEAALCAPAAPIVLLTPHDPQALAIGVAPGMTTIGLMLPYTPLHHLLMEKLDRPLVMTSGNRSSEPQAISNDEARTRLAGIADAWLFNDRDIVNRLDDSVVRVDASGRSILRRARGLAPQPLRLDHSFDRAPPVLALGGTLKAAFCFVRDGKATLSQHLGDLETPQAFEEFRKALVLYRELFAVAPAVIAVDLHRDYFSTQVGEALAAEFNAALVPVQHHHAHLAACLADNGIGREAPPSLGIVLDGMGLGEDGTIWGGELLVGGYTGFKRAGFLEPQPLVGGALAMREPWRNTLVQLRQAFGRDWQRAVSSLELGELLATKPLEFLERQLEQRANTPLSSSMGRLFDAVAAALGCAAHRQSYEGQAAMELEAISTPFLRDAPPYPLALTDAEPVVLGTQPLWRAVVRDLREDVPRGLIAARFHRGVADALLAATASITAREGISNVALSGGVMQNRILCDLLCEGLARSGLSVLRHKEIPANDGGLALGQAAIAAARHADAPLHGFVERAAQ